MNRKQRRELQRNKDSQDIQEQRALFNKLPDHCLTCEKPYDKNNKDR